MDFFALGYPGLFLASFLAATILPFSSEVLLTAMLLGDYDPVSCLLIATLGNTLGSYTNYFIGKAGKPEWLLKIGVKEAKLLRFEKHIKKYGSFLAFFSWIPLIGDPLTVALGFFRVPLIPVFLFVLLGKFLRYLAFTWYFL